MDQNEMKLIAQLKVLLAKETGQKIDLVRFAKDNAYAKLALELAAKSDNQELLVVAMQLMELRGLLEKPEPPQQPAEPVADSTNDRYIGRLR